MFIRHHTIQINKAEGFFVLYIGNVCGLCVLNKSKATTAAPVVKKMAHIKALNCDPSREKVAYLNFTLGLFSRSKA